jgi:hypothetical protein
MTTFGLLRVTVRFMRRPTFPFPPRINVLSSLMDAARVMQAINNRPGRRIVSTRETLVTGALRPLPVHSPPQADSSL